QGPLPPIPDGEGEHAVEAAQALGPPFLVGVQDHLGVAARAEDVAAGLQLGAQVEEVIQLAVVDDAASPVLVPNGLLAAGQVDDAEAANAEEEAAGVPRAALVGPAVVDAR